MKIDKSTPPALEGTNTWETLRNLQHADHGDRAALRGSFMRLLRDQRVPEALWVLKALNKGRRPVQDAPLPFADLPTSGVFSTVPLQTWPLPAPEAIRAEAPLFEDDCGASVEALFEEFSREQETSLNTVLYPSLMLTHLGTQADKGRALAQARRELCAVVMNVGAREQCVSTGGADGVSFYRVHRDVGDVLRVRVDSLLGQKLQHQDMRGVGYAPTVDIPWPMLSTPEGAAVMAHLMEILLPNKDWRKQSFTQGSTAEVTRWVSHVRHVLRSDPAWAAWPMADAADVSYPWLRWESPATDAVLDYFHYMRRSTQLAEFLRRQGATPVDVRVALEWNPAPDTDHDYWIAVRERPDRDRVDCYVALLNNDCAVLGDPKPRPVEDSPPSPTPSGSPSNTAVQAQRTVVMPSREDALTPLHQLIWEQGDRPLLDVQAWAPHLTPEAIHARDAHGHTPLHLACIQQNASVVDALLARGASFQTVNHFGHMPTDNLQFNAFWRRIMAAHTDVLTRPNQAFIEATTPAHWERVLDAVDTTQPLLTQVRHAMAAGVGLSPACLDDLSARGHLVRTVGHNVGLTGSAEGFGFEGDVVLARALTRMETLCAMLLDTRPIPAPLTRALLLQQLATMHHGPLLSMFFYPRGNAPDPTPDENAKARAPTPAKPAEAAPHARPFYRPMAQTVCKQVCNLVAGDTAILAGLSTERSWGESAHAVYLAAHVLPETPDRVTVACYNLGDGTFATNDRKATHFTPGTLSVPHDLLQTPPGKRALEQFLIALWMLHQRPEQDGPGLVYHAMGEFVERLERAHPGCTQLDVLPTFTRREQRAGNCSQAGLDYMLQAQLAVAIGGKNAFARAKHAYRAVKQCEVDMAQQRLLGRLNKPLNVARLRGQQRLAYLHTLRRRNLQAAKAFVAKHPELARLLTPHERQELNCRTWVDVFTDRNNQELAASWVAHIALGAAGGYLFSEACRLGAQALVRAWAPPTNY